MKQKKRAKHNRRPETSVNDQPQREPKDSSSFSTVSLLLLLAAMIYLSIQLSHLVYFKENREAFFYDQNTPILTTPDAYYYLRLTSDLLNDRYNIIDEMRPGYERPHPVPLIVSMSALAQRISGISIENIAFYLPPLLASLMVMVYFLWGFAASGFTVTLVASIAGTSSLYWCARTSLGYFDTDCLNPVFLYLILFFVYQFAGIQNRRRFVYLAAALFLCFIFRFWWLSGGHLGLSLIVFTYSTSFFLASSKGERLVKLSLLAMLSLGGLAVLLAYLGVLPGFLNRYLGPEMQYFELIGKTNLLFPNVGQSISELRSTTWRDFAVKVSGNEMPLALSMVGLFFLFRRKKEVANFLLPGLIFGLASLFSQRFIIFFVPVYAIGIGYFLGEVFLNGKHLQSIHRPVLRWGVWCSTLIILLSPSIYASVSAHPRPVQTASDVQFARDIANASGPQGLIWAWWDSGYFLQYITGRKTIIDGGSQSPQQTFIASYPLACEDSALSKNWIRFFAAHNPCDFDILVSHLGDIPSAVSFLKEALRNPADLENLLGRHKLNDAPFWQQYLFPQSEVYLFLDYATLSKGSWWYYFATWDFKQQQGSRPELFNVLYGNTLFSEQEGIVIDSDYVFKVDRVISVGSPGGNNNKPKYLDLRGRNHDVENMLAGLAQNKQIIFKPESVMVLNNRSHVVYLLDGKFFQSLVCQLLLQRPHDTGQFTPLAYFASNGGAWRVE
jgi:asparagine N-glycosylation enzyme membrane subunit Stt3